MAIEDVQKAIAEEQAARAAQQEKQRTAETKRAGKTSDSAAEKRKQDALRKISEKEVIYRQYIAQLASGKSKGKVLAPETLKRIENAAVELSNEIDSLRRIANPPAPTKEKMVGNLPESRIPFGGATARTGARGPISGGIETQDLGVKTPTKTPEVKETPSLDKDKGKGKGKDKDKVPEKRLTKEEIFAKYPIIDALFDEDPELKALLNKYLDPKSKMTLQQFKDELGQAQYNFRYADVIKQRMAEKAVYDRLGAGATGQTTYERNIANLVSTLEATAQELGATVTAEDLNRIATNIYVAGTEARPLVIERALTPFIKVGVSPITGRPTVGGAAGANYQSLLQTALANGINESLLPKVLGVKTVDDALRGLAEGKSIRDYENRFREYAMNGRSDYVKNLLSQGMDLDTIMAPYRNVMADVLEIANPEQIKLDDPTLNMAFADKEMTLTDFQRALRKDVRWQYTQKARDEMSSTALNLLRNFGFQG